LSTETAAAKTARYNTLGLIMPCSSNQNYTTDKADAQTLAKQFYIETRIVDLSEVKNEFVDAVEKTTNLNNTACANIAPRLRMTALYAVAASENRIVAGTGNRSEIHMGYFTKWGDGACDFNPIADLSVSEIYEFLRFLKAPACIIEKAPSAGLFDGQTDEKEMGITYRSIDEFLLNGVADEKDKAVIKKFHDKSGHKRAMPILFEG